MMKKLLPLILATVILFPSCKSIHGGMAGMHGSRDKNPGQDPANLHVMDDRFHVDIHIHPTEPLLMLFAITEAETDNPAQNISGLLSVRDTEVTSQLTADRPDQGQYAAVLRLPAVENGRLPLLLTIEDEQGVRSAYEFTFDPEEHGEDREDQKRGFLSTRTILIGSGMLVGMIAKLWLFGVL
jgi:hypothetical protein